MNSFEDSYPLLEFLGSGSFAEVWHARCNRTGEDVAVKVVDKAKLPNRKRIDSEILVHSALNHPSIVRLFKTFEDDQHVYLVMELCRGGTLQDHMKSRGGQLTENEAQPFFRQIVEGVQYLHTRGIIHRDLSLSNILLTDDLRIKISDFGLAKQLHHRDEKHSTMCGTPNFISPEIVTQNPHGLEADTFSLGCILYTLVVGKPPFDTQGLGSTLRRVRRVDFTLPHFLSPQVKALISALLKKDPKERLSLQGILVHPFLQKEQVCLKGKQITFQGLQDSGLGSTATTFSTTTTTTDEHSRFENGRRDNGQLSVILSEQSYVSLHSNAPCLPVQGRGSKCQSLTSECLHHKDFRLATGTPNKAFSDIHRSDQQQQSVSSHTSSHRSCSPQVTCMRAQPVSISQHLCSPNVTCMRDQSGLVCCNQPILSSPQPYPHQSQCLDATPFSTLPTQLSDKNSASVRCRESQTKSDSRWPQNCTSLAEILLPLTTQRLKPIRQKTKNAVVSISELGEITLEFLRVKGRQEKITSVCRISPDGMHVTIQRPSKEKSPLSRSDIKLREESAFTYHNLPKEHWPKYEYAVRFLGLVQAKTPKVTFYSQQAKCILMESKKDFEAVFYDSVKISSSGDLIRISSSGESLTIKVESDITARCPEFAPKIQHFRECHEHCLNIEGVLALVENKTNKTCFPLVIGKKPTSLAAIKDSKENCPPSVDYPHSSVRDVLDKPPLVSRVENRHRSCDSNIISTISRSSSSKTEIIKKVHIPNFGWAEQEKCGKITVQFQDGSHLDLPSRNNDLANPNKFRYRTSEGFCHIVTMSEQLDCDLRKKVELLPVFIKSLSESPVLLHGPSRVSSLSGYR